jgi:hypothetical protein
MALVKFADTIRSAASGFLATCVCDDSGACTCSYDGHHLFFTSKKGTQEMNILDKMKAANIKLEDIKAAAPSMSLEDLKALAVAVSAAAKQKEAQTGKEAQRKHRLAAAMEASATDHSAQNLLKNVREELRRIGLPNDLNAAAATGYQLGEIDKALKQSGWSAERRMNLKNKLDHGGLLTY